MAAERMDRKLAAIFAADIEGYSRLMEQDESATLAALTAHRDVLDPLVGRFRGRIANTAGDGVLAEFASVVDAVECAVELQEILATRNEAQATDRRLQFRIGIHVGEVMIKGGDLFGDSVNIAARLQALAAPGGICVSEVVRTHLGARLPLEWTEGGVQSVKNIAAPMRVFHSAAKGRPAAAPPTPPTLPIRPSIAVLPFDNMSSDTEYDYFAEGVADDIITELARNRDLFVVARHSSFFIAQRESDPVAVGRALGVRYLLGGSVRRARAQLRLTLHLVECESGREAWAERYDRKIEDLFEVQLDVARTVTATISGRLTALADEAITAKAPGSFQAYDHVLRAQRYLQRYTQADYARAREHLKAAVSADPSYARPYGLLCLAGVYDWFWEMPEDGLADVLEIGQRALSLDNGDAKAHLGLAVAHLFAWQHDRALHHMERAVALSPNDDLVAAEHARLLMALGRPDEGLSRAREAMRLNPFHSNWYWNIEGLCLQNAGRYQEAIDAYGRIDQPTFWVEAYLAACHAMCGSAQRAAHHRDRLLAMRPDLTMRWFRRGFPISSEAHLRRFLEGFRRAGIEE